MDGAQQNFRKLRLTVLPYSGKVDRLKEEAAQAKVEPAPPPSNPDPQPVPRPPTIAEIAHCNRNRLTAKVEAQQFVEAKVVDALRMVYDPEIPVNLYDLGLIYDILVDSENAVKIKMTLTAPGCPVAGTLPLEVEARVQSITDVKSAEVEIVWDPPWHRDMMSEVARLELGM